MYVNSDYLNYKYLVSVSDNYIILTNRKTVNGSFQNPVTYDIIYQYFYPSSLTIEAERTTSSTQNFTTIDVTDSYWERPDVSFINLSAFFIVILTLFVFNQVTEFIYKGGLAR